MATKPSKTRRPRRTSKLERLAIPVMIVGPIVVLVAGRLMTPYVPALVADVAHLVVLPMVFAVGFVMYFRGMRGRKRSLLESGLRVCLRCLQSLKAHPDAGICPECGTAYDVRMLRETWECEYPSLKLRPPDPPPMPGSRIAGAGGSAPDVARGAPRAMESVGGWRDSPQRR